jgi:DNA topoisomerase VI subunit B
VAARILKELVNNALDEAEEAEIAPEIRMEVSTEPGEIMITDNGRGIPVETVETMLDYTVRVSSREAYVSPTRRARATRSNASSRWVSRSTALTV